MDAATIATIITLLTPVIVGLIKKLIPYDSEKTFKRLLPVIPPLVGGILGYIGQRIGLQITPDLNNAVSGIFLGAMGSSVYDTGKSLKGKKLSNIILLFLIPSMFLGCATIKDTISNISEKINFDPVTMDAQNVANKIYVAIFAADTLEDYVRSEGYEIIKKDPNYAKEVLRILNQLDGKIGLLSDGSFGINDIFAIISTTPEIKIDKSILTIVQMGFSAYIGDVKYIVDPGTATMSDKLGKVITILKAKLKTIVI